MQCDKKSLLAEEDASTKRNLMTVGGHADNAVDLCVEDNTDAKRQCLGKGQTMLTKQPIQAEFEECWSEAIIKNGLSPSLVDDPLFRKALVTTARMGQSAVCMGKGIALGKRDTTLSHRHTFSRKIIPATDKRLDEEGMSRLKPRMKKVGDTLMSDVSIYFNMCQYSLRVTSPSLCFSYIYTGTQGHRYRVRICH
jgi:hypothetical protein